jgi:hypothetical protein
VENGWQKRQEWQANRTHNRTLSMLRKNLQISVEQKKDLRSTNHYFPVFFSACSSAVALLEDYVRIFVPPFELEHVVSQKRPVYSGSMLLDQRNPESVEKHFSQNRRDS